MTDLVNFTCALSRGSNVSTASLTFNSPMASNASRVSSAGAILVGGDLWRCPTAASPNNGNSSRGFTLRVTSATVTGSSVTIIAAPAQLTDAIAGMSIQYYIGDPVILPLTQRLRRYPTKKEIAAELGAAGAANRTGGRRLLSSSLSTSASADAAPATDAAAVSRRGLLGGTIYNAPTGSVTLFSANLNNAGPFSGSARATGSIAGSYLDITCAHSHLRSH